MLLKCYLWIERKQLVNSIIVLNSKRSLVLACFEPARMKIPWVSDISQMQVKEKGKIRNRTDLK